MDEHLVKIRPHFLPSMLGLLTRSVAASC